MPIPVNNGGATGGISSIDTPYTHRNGSAQSYEDWIRTGNVRGSGTSSPGSGNPIRDMDNDPTNNASGQAADDPLGIYDAANGAVNPAEFGRNQGLIDYIKGGGSIAAGTSPE